MEDSQALSNLFSTARQIKSSRSTANQLRTVVSPEEWLSYYYLGPIYDVLYPHWKEVFLEICNGGYNEVVAGGSLGCGKSTLGEILCARKFYELSCFENIPALFNLSQTSQLVFMYLSVNLQQAHRTGFGRLARMLDSAPYFKEYFPRDKSIDSMIRFKRCDQIVAYAGSDTGHFIGSDLFCIILDEANFLHKSVGSGGSEKFPKATTIYRESTNRRKTRFTVDGKEHGLSIIVSSVDTESSFTESRIEQGKGDKRFYYRNTSVLDVKRKDFSAEEFYVMTGIDNFDPFILCEDERAQAVSFYKVNGVPEEKWDFEVPPEEVASMFRAIPVDFLSTFKADIVGSLKEVLGVAVKKLMRLYYSKYNWSQCLDHERSHPFRAASFTVSTSVRGRNELIGMFIPENIIFDKDVLYFAHIDQSISRDCTGISLAHLETNAYSQIEKIVIDFMLQIKAPREVSAEIDIEKIRDFYVWLKSSFGIKFGKVTYDQYASRESMQQFKKKRIESELLSVDRNDTQYLETVYALNKHMIRMYHYPIFEKEFFNLKHYIDKRKVDHDPKPAPGKDVSDSVVGSVYNAITSLGDISKRQSMKDDISAFLKLNKQENILAKYQKIGGNNVQVNKR